MAIYDTMKALLPRGLAFTFGEDSNFARLLLGLADELQRVDTRVASLFSEAVPSTTDELLAEWEADAGCPKPWHIGSSDDERRADLCQYLEYVMASHSPVAFERLVYDILERYVSAYRRPVQSFVAGSPVGQAISYRWEFVWDLNTISLGPTDDARLVSLIEHYQPAEAICRVNAIDLAAWSDSNVVATSSYISGLAFGQHNGNRVAVAAGYGIHSCRLNEDVTVWTERFAEGTARFYSVCYGPSGFVAVGLDDATSAETIYHSLDGETWTAVHTGATASWWFSSVVWTGFKYFAIGRGSSALSCITATSIDGQTWSVLTSSSLPRLVDMAMSDSVIACTSNYSRLYRYSTDGVLLGYLNTSITAAYITYDSKRERFIAAAVGGTTAYIYDKTCSIQIGTITLPAGVYSILAVYGVLIVRGLTDVYSTVDDTTWVTASVPSSTPDKIGSDGREFVLVGATHSANITRLVAAGGR